MALSIGLLIERETVCSDGKKIGWKTKVTAVSPDWKLVDEYDAQRATIEDLLSKFYPDVANTSSLKV